METLTIAQTARHLGLSDQGTRKLINRQELFVLPGTDPIRLDAEHVETVRLLRRESIVHELARRQRTPVYLAHEARRVLFPPGDTGVLPHHVAEHQRRRLGLVSTDARQLFGVAALTAACSGDGCRWCRAADFARVLGGWAPDAYSEGFAALFDQKPCAECGPALYGALMERLRARVHPAGTGSSEARVPPSAAERAAAREWVQQRAVTAAAQPRQQDDDGGRALVQRRLRAARARLKTAKRANDQRYALRMAQQVRDLEKDAARVDGLTASAARPGTLRCGHALAAGCSCPRRASKR